MRRSTRAVRHSPALLAVLAVVGCAGGPRAPAPPTLARLPNVPAAWPMLARAQSVPGERAMVVSASPIASQVGADILKAGGNAMDAAVAVGFALAVVHPEAGNIGGGGFMVIRLADGTVRTIDYRETAPGKATANMFMDAEGNLTQASVTGHLASGVPGSVAGMAEVERAYGKLGLARVVAPAIALARDGFVVDRYRAGSIAAEAERLRRFPASKAQFLPDNQPPAVGSTLKQPDLAATLQAIADSGPGAFYTGHIADLIAAEMQRGGGLISKEDLAAYKAIWRDPIVIHYRGHTIYSMPPSSSGGVTMAETLNMLEGFSPLPAFGSAEQVHLFAEAMRRAFIDRNSRLGDPAFVQMPLDRLLSKEYAGQLRATINRDHATPTQSLSAPLGEGDQTTHFSVVDSAGNAVSVTTTLNGGYGSAVTVTGAGFVLNNEMDDFTGAPGKPNMYGLIQGESNAIRPGKRMLSAMTPSIVLDSTGHLFMVVGTPGGPTIITTVTEVISNVIDQHMSLADAVAAPRMHHQSLPDEIYYEKDGLLPATVERLQNMGHKVVERRGYSGDVAAIERTPNGWVGVADPRHGGAAVGY